MNYLLFLSIFFGLSIFYFILGYIASKKMEKTSDYFLAGRKLGLVPVTFTLIATQLGGGMLLGTSQEAYSIGLYGIMYTVGMSLGFLILGLGFASRLQSFGVSTTAELFETKYKSPNLKKIASLLSVVAMFGLLIGQIIGSRFLIEGLGIHNEFVFIAFWAIVITYTIMGGLKAVAITDTVQVIFVIVIFSSIFIFSLLNEPISFFSFLQLTKNQYFFSSANISYKSLIGIALMPALFSLIEQDLAQRFFASRTKKIAAVSAILASIFLLLFSLVPIYFGMKAKLMGIEFSGSPLIPVISLLTNEFVLILVVCAIIAAITSTGDSLLCAISSNVSQDFNFSFLGIKNKLRLSKTITFFIGVLAVIGSYFVPKNIISIMIGSYEISVCCLLIPLLFSYFKEKLNKNAAIGSIIFGLAGFILFRIYPIPFPREIASLVLSMIGYLMGNKCK